MALKSKIMNLVTAQPKLVIFSIGLAITFVIGTAIGMVEDKKHMLHMALLTMDNQPIIIIGHYSFINYLVYKY